MIKILTFILFLLLYPTGLNAKTQVIFLIDASSSIDDREFAQINLALQNLQLPENIKNGSVHFIQWSTEPLQTAYGELSNFSKITRDFWENGRQMSGGTAVGHALNFVMQEVYDPTATEHYVILITDGDNNVGPSPLETNYRSWSILKKVNTSILVIDDQDWLVNYYQPLRIGFKSLIVHAKDFDQLSSVLQLLVNSIFTK